MNHHDFNIEKVKEAGKETLFFIDSMKNKINEETFTSGDTITYRTIIYEVLGVKEKEKGTNLIGLLVTKFRL